MLIIKNAIGIDWCLQKSFAKRCDLVTSYIKPKYVIMKTSLKTKVSIIIKMISIFFWYTDRQKRLPLRGIFIVKKICYTYDVPSLQMSVVIRVIRQLTEV